MSCNYAEEGKKLDAQGYMCLLLEYTGGMIRKTAHDVLKNYRFWAEFGEEAPLSEVADLSYECGMGIEGFTEYYEPLIEEDLGELPSYEQMDAIRESLKRTHGLLVNAFEQFDKANGR